MSIAKFITDAIDTAVKYKSEIPDDILEKFLAELEHEIYERELKRNPDLFRTDWPSFPPESKL